jgi:hypothetical protein
LRQLQKKRNLQCLPIRKPYSAIWFSVVQQPQLGPRPRPIVQVSVSDAIRQAQQVDGARGGATSWKVAGLIPDKVPGIFQ